MKKIAGLLLCTVILFTTTACNTRIVEMFRMDGSPTASPVSVRLELPSNTMGISGFMALSPYRYYGRTQLPERLVPVYDAIVVAAANYEPAVPIDVPLSLDELKLVMRYYDADYPHHFWMDNTYSIYRNSKDQVVKLELRFAINQVTAQKMQQRIDAKVAKIFDGITSDMTPFEIELLLHDRLISSIKYDETFEQSNTYNIYGAFVSGRAVCQAYAKAFQYLLYNAGMQCLYVSGVSKEQGHGWNMAYIEDGYYYIDPTWNDPISPIEDGDKIYHTYFNLTEEEISFDHKIIREDNYPLPQTGSGAQNYFKKLDLVFYDFTNDSKTRLARIVADMVSKGETGVSIKLKADDFNALKDELFSKEIFRILSIAKNEFGCANLNTSKVFTSVNEEFETVTFELELLSSD